MSLFTTSEMLQPKRIDQRTLNEEEIDTLVLVAYKYISVIYL